MWQASGLHFALQRSQWSGRMTRPARIDRSIALCASFFSRLSASDRISLALRSLGHGTPFMPVCEHAIEQ